MKFLAVIHKAMLDIGNQSVDEFTKDLTDALAEGPLSGARWLWVSDLYSDHVVMSYEADSVYTYYSVTFTRDAASLEFTFGDPVEVKRQSFFVPV